MEKYYNSLILWRNIQGILLLTMALLPACLYLGLSQSMFMKIWTTLLICMSAAWVTRMQYRLRVDLDDSE